jgi:hypothetical protein
MKKKKTVYVLMLAFAASGISLPLRVYNSKAEAEAALKDMVATRVSMGFKCLEPYEYQNHFGYGYRCKLYSADRMDHYLYIDSADYEGGKK